MEPYTIDLADQHPNSVRILDQFDTYRTAFKHINDQPIHAFFVIPKNLAPGPRPLLVRFHGGAWTEGEAEASLRPFFLELALKHGAVLLTPDYRLRPEHEIKDGVDDIRDFWKWVENGEAQKVLNKSYPDLEVDINNMLVGGESGGGYLTVQTVLLGMTSLPIKVLFVQYPAVHLARMFAGPEQGEITHPYSIVEEHLATVKSGTICTRAKFGSRMHIFRAMRQAGRVVDVSGENAWIDPMSSLETSGKLPPMLVYHSKEDPDIPWEDTDAWVTKLKKLQPDVPLHLVWKTGGHTFDTNHTMETPWLKEPLEFVQGYWPAH